MSRVPRFFQAPILVAMFGIGGCNAGSSLVFTTSGGAGGGGGGGETTSTGGSGSTTGQSGATGVGSTSVNYVVPAGWGAAVPWIEQQAEAAATNGTLLGPSRVKWDPNHIEAEAIGRMAVKLQQVGDYVEFTTTASANSLTVRFCIPDAPTGGGLTSTLGVYINGKRLTSLQLTSHYAWSYEGGLIPYSAATNTVDNPNFWPHTFFDEAHIGPGDTTPLGELPAGTKVRLQRDQQDNNVAYHIIDLADFEEVAPPGTIPAGFTDVTTLGIKGDGVTDNAQTLLNLLQSNSGQKYWFPPGTYLIQNFSAGTGNVGLDNHGNEIAGAGMWYTHLRSIKAFFCDSGACNIHDLSIFGETVARDEQVTYVQKAFAGPLGTNSQVYNLWIEHEVAGIWVGNDPPYQAYPTTNLHIHDVRIRNTYADGINLDDGTSYSLVENTTMRNTGDDSATVWSIDWPLWVEALGYADGSAANAGFTAQQVTAPGAGPAHDNIFTHITVQMPWRADCFAAYGGYNNQWLNSVCEDVLTYPGAFIDHEFSPYPFGSENSGITPSAGMTTFQNLAIIRAGGEMFGESTSTPWVHGALKFYMREGDVVDINVNHVDIVDPTYAGIEFRGYGAQYELPGTITDPNLITSAAAAKFMNVNVQDVNVYGAGTYGIDVFDCAGNNGSAVNGSVVNFTNVVVQNSNISAVRDSSVPASFFNKVSGNVGW